MKVLITGATGFIGRRLMLDFLSRDYAVTAVSRSPEKSRGGLPASVHVVGWEPDALTRAVAAADIIVNLAGEPIAGGLWTKKRKAAIVNSRVLAAQRLADAIGKSGKRPGLFIQASAIGYYGSRGDEVCTETTDQGEGFLAGVCKKWESHDPEIQARADRLLTLRIGLVLGREGGLLPVFAKQAKWHVAGKIGHGKQWMSWIHIADFSRAVMFLTDDVKADGVFNMVAPSPCRQAEFSRFLANALGRRLQLPAPAWAIRLLTGEMGRELVLGGQRVSAGKLLGQGFAFIHHEAGKAILEITGKEKQ
jgi:uncharacterized protein